MALDIDACAKALSNAYEAYKQDNMYKPPEQEKPEVPEQPEKTDVPSTKAQPRAKDFMETFNDVLDTFSQMAEPEKKNVVILTAATTLDIERKDDPKEQNLEIATKYMAYWALCIAPIGIPETLPKGGTIVSVVNDATSYVSDCKSDLDDLAKSNDKGEPYVKFVEILFKYAKKVQWTVTEQWINPAGPTTMIETYQVKVS